MIAPADRSYATFCSLVTGYRQLSVIMAAVDCGVIDAVAAGHCDLEQLLKTTGMRAGEGERFVNLLVSAGILLRCDELLQLSPFSAAYLRKESDLCQRRVLEFEQLLQGRWQGLGGQLLAGQGSGAQEQDPGEYRQRLGLFHGAMHEAAVVRAAELWEAVGPLAGEGLIIDAGAGDGTYLESFLGLHPGWSALACDLGDVLATLSERWGDCPALLSPCNLLDQAERFAFVDRNRGRAGLLLLSNFIHCYSAPEVTAMLADLGGLVAPDGLLVIHDFFTDANDFGALYDLHMLVNTYNGRTYRFNETEEMLALAGFTTSRRLALPSLSHALVARR